MSRLVLIDGNAILHRAFHALPAMNNSKGQPTNAVYGFVSMLFAVIKELKPTHIAVAFDRPKPTFRKQLFKEYQSQRPEMDKELVSQIKIVHQVLETMRISIYEKDGYEADDVIGTITKQSVNKKVDEVIVMTGDRDLLQLVNKKVKLYMPVKGLTEAKLYGEKETEERMGVPPGQITDLKGLMGDASDNYPGVAGIGPKTAILLLKEFGSVASVYKHLSKLKNPSLVEKLTKDKKNALLSHQLATVVTDAPIDFDAQKSELHDLATREVIELFGSLEFKTLLKRLLNLQNYEAEKSIQETNVKTKKDDQLGLF